MNLPATSLPCQAALILSDSFEEVLLRLETLFLNPDETNKIKQILFMLPLTKTNHSK